MSTAKIITELEAHEVFVFGSNAAGAHGAGAARTAYEKFGALWGEGHEAIRAESRRDIPG